MGSKIVIGSRGSELALWQANHVKSRLENNGHQVKIKVIQTKGDRIQDIGFDKLEGKGFFTKEIEQALLDKEIDLAVHSLKDLETTQPSGLVLAAVSERESPRDVILVKEADHEPQQPLGVVENGTIGTSSARRKAWIQAARPDVTLEDIRGNVPTRIRKLREGDLNAIVLAEAGLNRIQPDVSGLTVVPLEPEQFVPAPAQGVLGLQTRADDDDVIRAVKAIEGDGVADLVNTERSVLSGIGGGCHVPLGAYCQRTGEVLELIAWYQPEGSTIQEFHGSGQSHDLVEQALISLKSDSSYQEQ